jgi:hypothetical protein
LPWQGHKSPSLQVSMTCFPAAQKAFEGGLVTAE